MIRTLKRLAIVLAVVLAVGAAGGLVILSEYYPQLGMYMMIGISVIGVLVALVALWALTDDLVAK